MSGRTLTSHGYAPGMEAGLVPVKRLDKAKSRLSPAYSDEQRRAVARALFEDALDLCDSVDFLQWWFVSDDDEVRAEAEARGFSSIEDSGAGLNAALAVAVERLSVAQVDSVTVIPSDIPLAWKGDMQDLVDTGATSDMVVVPAEGDGGTNGLYLSPPTIAPPRFGKSSLAAHLAEAERLGVRCAILNLPRLALDIDTPEDVETLLAKPRPGSSRAVDLLRTWKTEDD